MAGAAERDRRQRALVWWGAMMPHLEKPPSFNDFVDPPVNAAQDARQSPEVLDAMLAALAVAWGAEKVH